MKNSIKIILYLLLIVNARSVKGQCVCAATGCELVCNGGFEVLTTLGVKPEFLLTHLIENNVTKLDISSFNNGTYLFKIIKNKELIKADKLIINR